MKDTKLETAKQTSPLLENHPANDHHKEPNQQGRSSLQTDPTAQITCRLGDTSCAGAHAETLNRTTIQPASDALLRLQRQYGNQFVQRVVHLSRQAAGEVGVPPDVEQAIQKARGGGQALDNTVRTQMESAFGTDFSSVRVHTDSQADSLNHSLGARAFATGQDIFFKQGEYNPASSSGCELLAHELTHVLQHNNAPVQSQLTLGAPHDEYEREADRVAHTIMEQVPLSNTEQSNSHTIQRKKGEKNGVRGEHSGGVNSPKIADLGQKTRNRIYCDFAVPPTTPNRRVRTLTEAQIQDAIAYNRARHTDANEIGLMRDILGVNRSPSVIDNDFVLAVVRYQAQYGLDQDGRIGGRTADRLAREIVAESQRLGAGNLGSLAPEFQLKTSLETLVNGNNRTYATYKNAIQAASIIQRHVVLQDQSFLRRLQGLLPWNNFAKCIELLGRQAPTGAEMRTDPIVRAALNTAWAASTPAITIWPVHDNTQPAGPCNPPIGAPPPATPAHEEGGFIYMNLITSDLATRPVPAGGQAVLTLNNPPLVADSIVVGAYHTHPNVGVCWGAPFFSTGIVGDTTWTVNNGVPLLMRGAFPAIANISDHATGTRRRHLAGNRGLPGASGGLAPQATSNRSYDEL